MSKVKTVVLFVDYTEDGVYKPFIECTEVGKGQHYEHPSEFINEFKKLYREASKGVHKFTITNIVIG